MAKAFLPQFRQRISGATGEERIALLFALSDVVGKPEVMRKGSESAQTAYWRAYHDALGHLPADVLSRACKAYISLPTKPGESKWFPDPGALLHLAKQDEAWIAACRITRGLDRIASSAVPRKREPLTPAQEAELEARNAEMMAKLRSSVRTERDDLDQEARRALDQFKNPRPWQQQATT